MLSVFFARKGTNLDINHSIPHAESAEFAEFSCTLVVPLTLALEVSQASLRRRAQRVFV